MLVRALPNAHDPLPDGRTNPSITIDKLYVVIGIVDNYYGVVDDDGEPIWFPRSIFDVIDGWIPDEWVLKEADEVCSCKPAEFSRRGFFERWHDGYARERQVFAEVYMLLWAHYADRMEGQKMVLKGVMSKRE